MVCGEGPLAGLAEHPMASIPLQGTGKQVSAAIAFESTVPKPLWIQHYTEVMIPVGSDGVQRDQLSVAPSMSCVPAET